MLMNTGHHHHCPSPQNNVGETFHPHINNAPESQHEFSGNDRPSDHEHLLDSYSPPFPDNMDSTQTSPVANSQWSYREQPVPDCTDIYSNFNGLLASLVREEGNVYSLAAIDDMLFTGSDSKNIRVWKNLKEFSGFKSTSGLVKSIVVADDKIFTGHSDGKIRVWNASVNNPNVYKKIQTLPNLYSIMEKSIKPKNYTEVWRNQRAIWIKHFDVISSLDLSEDHSLLYSSSWDKTIKVWNVSNFKCLESIPAHDDVVNAVVAGFDGFVLSGSADGVVKLWRREFPGKRTKHSFVQTLLNQESAVTSLVVNPSATVVYAGLSDGILHFWERDDLNSGGRVLRWHKLAVLCLTVAGSLVFSGSADANICVWRRDDGGEHECVCVLKGHDGPVKCLAVDVRSREGVGARWWTLYSGGLDRSVKIWRVCTRPPETKDLELSLQAKQKDRPCPSCDDGFPTFIDQGRLNQQRK